MTAPLAVVTVSAGELAKLIREALRAELSAREPALAPELSAKAAAKAVRRRADDVLEAVRTGAIEAKRVGKSWRVNTASLLRWAKP